MKLGIIEETNKAYHSDKSAISKSRLAKMSVCPKYFKWCEENEQAPTEDLIFGSAFHKAILEETTFFDEFCILPTDIDKRTKVGKERYAEFLQENEDKCILTQEQYDTILQMKKAVEENKYCNALIEGNREKSIYFNDDLTRLSCKVRPDVYKVVKDGTKVIITDLKSCKSAVAEDFMRDIVKYSYDLQAYMYSLGVSKTLNIPMENVSFCFIAVEKKAPHLVGIYEANSDILARGEMLFRKYIGQLEYCLSTGNWYSFNGYTNEPKTIGLPDWVLKNSKGE